jgi:hypothetical protein
MSAHVIVNTAPCIGCGHSTQLTLLRSEVDQYRKGAFVQDAFPFMTADERELIVSGTHPACWRRLFGEDF